jgi:hypothetical protein
MHWALIRQTIQKEEPVKRLIPLLLAACGLLMAQGAWLGNPGSTTSDAPVRGGARRVKSSAIIERKPASVSHSADATAEPYIPAEGRVAMRRAEMVIGPTGEPADMPAEDSIYYDNGLAYVWGPSTIPGRLWAGVRFTTLVNCSLKAATYYRYRMTKPQNAGYDTVYIYAAGPNDSTPGSLLTKQSFSNRDTLWRRVNLAAPQYFTGGQSFWIAVAVYHDTNHYALTSDGGSDPHPGREWLATGTGSTWLRFDPYDWNVRAFILPLQFANDMAAISIDGMVSPLEPGLWLTLKGTVKNLGTDTRAPGVPVRLSITGPSGYSYTDNEATRASLDYGMTEQVTFVPNWRTPSVYGTYTMKVWTDLTSPPDGNRANDTTTYLLDVSPWITYANWNAPTWYTGDREERGSWFFPTDFALDYPVTVESLKTQFYYNPSDPWDDSTYQFIIYAGDLSTVLYTSPSLEAVDGVNKYAVDPPVTLTTGSFAVMVVPVSASGAPWSLADGTFRGRSLLKQGGVWYWWNNGELFNAAFVSHLMPPDDIGFYKVNAPLFFTEPNVAMTPSGTILNFGTNPVTAAPCSCYVYDTLTDAQLYAGHGTVSAGAGETAHVAFSPQWTPPAGSNVYRAILATFLPGDGNGLNDSVGTLFSAFHAMDSLIAPTKATGVNVTVDGTINAAEWWDANVYDVSNVMGWNDPAYYYFPNNAWLYLKHDATTLYGAVDLPFETANDSTEIGLYVDENNDHVWAADSSEGNYWAEHFPGASPTDSIIYRGLAASGAWRTRARGSKSRTGMASGHQQYEFSIPLGTAKCSLNLNPNGDTCGFWFYMMNDHSAMTRGWWKTTMADNGGVVVPPANYGHLFLTGTTNPLPDAGVFRMIAPSGIIDTSAVVSPRATIKNFGSVPATVQTWYFIDSIAGQHIYSSTFTATLAVGDTVQHQFADWAKPHAARRYLTRCSTYAVGDPTPGNNVMDSAFTVARPDVGVDLMVAPAGSYDTSDAVVPRARLKNFGLLPVTFQTWFFIDSIAGQHIYTDAYTATLAAGDTVTHTYAAWVKPHVPRHYATRCSTFLATDPNPANNRSDSGFTVTAPPTTILPDVAAAAIISPTGSPDTAAVVTPTATWTNNGPGAASFHAIFKMDSGATHTVFYSKDSLVNAQPEHSSITIAFAAWAKPHPVGSYNLLCSAYCAVDTHHVNDAQHGSFAVVLPGQALPSWAKLSDLLPGGKNKNVKDGGALAYGKEATDNDTGYVYAFKGNNRYEFYRYNTVSLAWISRDSIPATGRSGKKKAVKKGSALIVGADSKVYGAKGNNTYEFWCYDPARSAGQHWTQLGDVPIGGKALKEGTGLASVSVSGTSYIYFLKGSGTYEFYRYKTSDGSWATMADAPAGTSNKPYKNGSSVTYDGGDTIWALKGSYNELFAYSISNNNWITKDTLPKRAPPGTKKTKVKDGSQIAYAGRVVYALKGANTNEFWTYLCDSHRWQHSTDMTTVVKKVKGGGALVYAGSSKSLYAFRGNNTLEFWSYGPVNVGGLLFMNCPLPKDEQGQTAAITSQFALRVTPNPFTSRTSISYSLPRAGNVSLRLYDVTGQLVTTLAKGYTLAGSHAAHLDASKLAHGIYLLKYENEGSTTTSKLIVE